MTIDIPTLLELEAQPTAVIRGRVPLAELPSFFDRAFGALAEAIGRQGATPAGPAFARYEGPPTEIAELEVGFPVGGPIEPDGDVVAGTLPAGTVARAVHAGAYDGLGEAWGALAQWISEQGRTPGRAMWESYLTEPTPDMDPAGLRTELTWTLD